MVRGGPPDRAALKRIVVRSIGTAGANIVGALRQALPLPEEHLAACVVQAPAELLGPMAHDTAESVAAALRLAGLDVDVLDPDEPITPGGPDFDVALVIRRFDQLVDVVAQMALFLGVTSDRARHMVCTCPIELIGKVSAETVAAIRRRFEPLGVTVDASLRRVAVFDAFLTSASDAQRELAYRLLRDRGVAPACLLADARLTDCIAAGLGADEAQVLWQHARQAALPMRILNREFQRFDVRLDHAPDTPGLHALLVESAGMPEQVARRIAAHTPVVTHGLLRQHEALEVLERIEALGGSARALLIAMQRFRLQLVRIGDADSTVRLLEVLGGMDAPQARALVRSRGMLDAPATAHQARWLQHELKRVGTDARMLTA